MKYCRQWNVFLHTLDKCRLRGAAATAPDMCKYMVALMWHHSNKQCCSNISTSHTIQPTKCWTADQTQLKWQKGEINAASQKFFALLVQHISACVHLLSQNSDFQAIYASVPAVANVDALPDGQKHTRLHTQMRSLGGVFIFLLEIYLVLLHAIVAIYLFYLCFSIANPLAPSLRQRPRRELLHSFHRQQLDYAPFSMLFFPLGAMLLLLLRF